VSTFSTGFRVGIGLAQAAGMTLLNVFKQRSKHSLILVAVASCTVLSGCGADDGGDDGSGGSSGGSSGSSGGSAGSSGGSSGDPVQDYFDALPDWDEVPEPSDTASDSTTERRHLTAADG
jgi:hypothetical protein